jgi:hypothetical protein
LNAGGFGVTSLNATLILSNKPLDGVVQTGQSSDPSKQVDRRYRDKSLDTLYFYNGTIKSTLRRLCVRTNEEFIEESVIGIEGGVSLRDWQESLDEDEDERQENKEDDLCAQRQASSKLLLNNEVTVTTSSGETKLLSIVSNYEPGIILSQTSIDIGELVVQELCGEIDPYPKMPGTKFVEFVGEWY